MNDLAGEIAAMERRRYAAMVAADPVALDELLHDELSYIHANSVVDTKASMMRLLADGSYAYRAVRPHIDTVAGHGDTAILTGTADLDVHVHGAERTVEVRYTAVWVRHRGSWRFAAWQSTTRQS